VAWRAVALRSFECFFSKSFVCLSMVCHSIWFFALLSSPWLFPCSRLQTLCCIVDANRASIQLVNSLKQKVLDNYPRYDKGAFFFELDGKPLSTKSSYRPRLADGSTVFVQYRNRGGCFVVSLTLMMTIFALIISSPCTCGASLLFIPLLLPFLFVLPLFCL
jgi:hypothetical protein